METALDRFPWQHLPDMRESLPSQLAGIAAGVALLTLWHMHGASRHAMAAKAASDTPARRVAQTAAAARVTTGLKADALRRNTLDALARATGGKP